MVLVVEELARAANYSLGGYATNDTNFYTKNEPNLIYFSNVHSCGTYTALSFPCLFSREKRSEFKSSQNQENALDVLKRVGVDVVWLGNNSGRCKGVCDRLDKQNVRYFDGGFDGVMLKDLQSEIENATGDKLIVFHIQGSHGPTYYQRYPAEFRKFTPTCDTSELSSCSFESIINTYDNTILYTDFIISEIIKFTKSRADMQSSLWYFSDHGESLGEGGIYLHSMPYAIAPEYQKHIPMMFYSNDEAVLNLLKNKKRSGAFAR